VTPLLPGAHSARNALPNLLLALISEKNENVEKDLQFSQAFAIY